MMTAAYVVASASAAAGPGPDPDPVGPPADERVDVVSVYDVPSPLCTFYDR